MAQYKIEYTEDGVRLSYTLGAPTEAAARNKFLNLSFVAFKPVVIQSCTAIGPAKGGPAVEPEVSGGRRTAQRRIDDFRAEVSRLSDEAYALEKEGKRDLADEAMAKVARLNAAINDEVNKIAKKRNR